jgi:hypothetical protein
MKNAIFWDVAPCIYFVNRRFGETYCLHLQGIRNSRAMNQRDQVAVDCLHGATFQKTAFFKLHLGKIRKIQIKKAKKILGEMKA